MKAYRIHNDIVAAGDEQEAIRTWAQYDERPAIQAGPVEEVPTTLEIMIEDDDGNWRKGTLAEAMPSDAQGPGIVCEGECETCGGSGACDCDGGGK